MTMTPAMYTGDDDNDDELMTPSTMTRNLPSCLLMVRDDQPFDQNWPSCHNDQYKMPLQQTLARNWPLRHDDPVVCDHTWPL
jgi:hypothetical protein